jgi:hypothetical protein
VSKLLLSLLIAICGGVFIYTRLQQRTGYGNSRSAAQGAAITALIIFVLVFSLSTFLLP